MAEIDFPYRAEYSKSSRAKCKSCKETIEKDVLRLAAMVQSPMFDGKIPNWYHEKCFFIKQRPSTVADIAHFDSLRYADQEKIKSRLEQAGGSATPAAKGRGKGSGKSSAAAGGGSSNKKEFSVEMAKSGKAGCKGCEMKILKGEVRISKMDYTSDSARRYGPLPRWHHLDCFLELRHSLEWYDAAEILPGFYALPAEEQEQLKKAIPAVKRKAEDTTDAAPAAKKIKKEDELLMKKQNDVFFKFRDSLKALEKLELIELIEHNIFNFNSSGMGESVLLDRAADLLTFGVPAACDLCKEGILVFRSGVGYACTGHISDYTSCTNVVKAPKRRRFQVPAELAAEYSFLKKYKDPGLGDRLFTEHTPRTVMQPKDEELKPLAVARKLSKPLLGLGFVVHKSAEFPSGRSCDQIKELLKNLGASVLLTVTKNAAALISTADSVSGADKVIAKAKELGVHCVPEEYLDKVKEDPASALALIKQSAISDWGEDPEARVTKSKLYSSTHKSSRKADSQFTKSVPDKLVLQLKDGGAVDPDSGLADSTHVLKKQGKLYSSVLSYVNVSNGANSYYKLQLLESDTKDAWWVFRSWGRIGTSVGGTKLEDMSDLFEAISHFKELFEEKTGNNFTSNTYTKVPGRWTVLDVEFDTDEVAQPLTVSAADSKLPLPVQELVKLIFDIDCMKSQMKEFEIDLKKLPLGKLSERQLLAAYSVLTEAQQVLSEDSKHNGTKILDCSNRFYTLIPHDFGMNKAPLLDNFDIIKSKVDMVESLREIQTAYCLLKSKGDAKNDGASLIEQHYEKLNTKLEVVDEKSEEFEVLQQYVTNTHASTHAHYKLQIDNIFRVERQGEAKRFKPFKKLHNHKLLWHGSRLTNFAGILSQGLRIAPPEAPSTGYMFGKGIYFADMVSKSANYCATSNINPTGLLLLCDVALGNMEKKKSAAYVTKLPGGKHSTMGCGSTFPDPDGSRTLHGIEVPCAKPKHDRGISSSLLYNEYIVYDVAQVQVKYLVRMKFLYN